MFVYRNIVKALPWFSAVRAKLADPRYAGWFLPFKNGVQGNYSPRGTGWPRLADGLGAATLCEVSSYPIVEHHHDIVPEDSDLIPSNPPVDSAGRHQCVLMDVGVRSLHA